MMNWNRLLNESGAVTPQQISDFDHMRKDRREMLTLFRQPIATLKTFALGGVALVYYTAKYLFSHSLFLYLLLPSAAVWFVLDCIPGPHTEVLGQIEFGIEFAVWWLGLGILSSIGLGSGLQSGVLFLFPHIIKVALAAQTCKTLDFESYSDMWFRSPPNLFKCPPLTPESTPVTLWGTWQKILLVCFLQSAGTAIGEIPPYWMTKAARLAAIEAGTSNSDDMPEELSTTSRYNIINRAKTYMVWFLRTHGFYGVLIMASYPNIAFDLCGIACGHFLMPFWTFFGATFLGKAVVRNGYQSIIYVMLCSEEYLELLIRGLQALLPDQLHLDAMIREALEEGRESFRAIGQNQGQGVIVDGNVVIDSNVAGSVAGSENMVTSAENEASLGSYMMIWWRFIMTFFLLAFFLSCISHFAQYYQMTLDQDDSNKLRRRLPNSVRLELASPTSGRLKLPPPTPVTVAATREAIHLHGTAHRTPGVALFPKTPLAYAKTPKNKTPQALRENQLSENNPQTPEASSVDNSMRKRE